MITHVVKGYTLGYLLTRRLGRTLTGLIGLPIDMLIAAIFMGSGDYMDFWRVHTKNVMSYLDGSKVDGIFQTLFGWIGDLIGAPLGGLVGIVIGGAAFLVDSVFRSLIWSYQLISTSLTAWAQFVADQDYLLSGNPQNHFAKAWNISASTLGVLVSFPLFIPAKIVEFLFPVMGDVVSSMILDVAMGLAGMLGGIAGLVTYPINHFAERAISLYNGFRDKVRSLSAFVYAKTDAEIDRTRVQHKLFHSEEFLTKVDLYKAKSTTEIIFSKLKLNSDAGSVESQVRIDEIIESQPLLTQTGAAANALEQAPLPSPSAPPKVGEADNEGQPGLGEGEGQTRPGFNPGV